MVNPGGIQNIILFFSLKIIDLYAYVGEFFLKSTTSSTRPVLLLTFLEYLEDFENVTLLLLLWMMKIG